MGNHPFNVIVVVFWLATMGWLIVAKVLPPLRVGEPPNYASILKDEQQQPVGWIIHMNDDLIGWAASKTERRSDGIADMYSRVYLAEFPLDEFAPAWLRGVLRPMLEKFRYQDVDKNSTLVIDPLGRLVRFDSRVRLAHLPDAIRVEGHIDGARLKLTVKSGGLPDKLEHSIPPNALMSDELSPQSRLPGLRIGQTWTVPLYSPFRGPNSPVEILQAVVERRDKIAWGGRVVNCLVVVYRADSGSGLSAGDVRGRMWVRDDGVVVQQEVTVFNARLHFVRLSGEQAEPLWQQLGDDWTAEMPRMVAHRLLAQLQADEAAHAAADDAEHDDEPRMPLSP